MVSTTMPNFGAFNNLIGWDSIFNRLSNIQSDVYPPYNLVKINEDRFLVEMAIAGYTEDDLSIRVEDNTLIIKGQKEPDEKEYIHKGISSKSFIKTFSLAEYIEVIEAKMIDGILYISLERNLPEAKKPRVIEINSNKKKLTK